MAGEVKNLKQWRAVRGLTQMQLASRIGATLATVANVENGRNHPTYDTWRKIADALGIRMEQIEWPATTRPYPSKANRSKSAA